MKSEEKCTRGIPTPLLLFKNRIPHFGVMLKYTSSTSKNKKLKGISLPCQANPSNERKLKEKFT